MTAPLHLGRGFRAARALCGLRQKDLAEVLGCTSAYLSMLEHDQRDPSWSFLWQYSVATGIEPERLIALAREAATLPR